VLYVGKSAVAAQPRASYFLESARSMPRPIRWFREIADLETIVVANEREALALENNLIKRYHPKFNVSAARRQNIPLH